MVAICQSGRIFENTGGRILFFLLIQIFDLRKLWLTTTTTTKNLKVRTLSWLLFFKFFNSLLTGMSKEEKYAILAQPTKKIPQNCGGELWLNQRPFFVLCAYVCMVVGGRTRVFVLCMCYVCVMYVLCMCVMYVYVCYVCV